MRYVIRTLPTECIYRPPRHSPGRNFQISAPTPSGSSGGRRIRERGKTWSAVAAEAGRARERAIPPATGENIRPPPLHPSIRPFRSPSRSPPCRVSNPTSTPAIAGAAVQSGPVLPCRPLANRSGRFPANRPDTVFRGFFYSFLSLER